MLTINDKQYRNLEEQVLKNAQDINYILNEQGVLNEFGIKVVGQLDYYNLLPSVDQYKEDNPEWEYGDAFAIGLEAPYTLYILTRANGTEPNDYWFNIGQFPMPGATGAQGPAGEKGEKGEPGEKGETGPQGVQGLQGIQGIPGVQGVAGPIGPQGIQGERGEPGDSFQIIGTLTNTSQLPTPTEDIRSNAYLIPDEDGDNHLWVILGTPENLYWNDAGQIVGVKGEKGEIGPQGPAGVQGPQGVAGPQGLTGLAGPTGPEGPRGPQGVQGLQGPQGLQGLQGEPGPKGDTGAKGDKGDKGDTGSKGDKGDIGPQGIQGLVGPAGPAGPQGIAGPQGPKGDKGESGNSFTIIGTVNTAQDLPSSATAGTAYFVGIVAPRNVYVFDSLTNSWINQGTLQGPQGEQGVQGIQGEQGIPGPTGPQGLQGIQGEKGEPGEKGETGSAGPKGDKGDKGDPGATGPVGPQGVQGEQGPMGPQGPKGDTGDTAVEVIFSNPSSATSGSITVEQLNTLQASNQNYIIFANEIYHLNDVQTSGGYLIYTHIGQDNTKTIYIKEIAITISTRGWVLTKFQPQEKLTFDNTPTADSNNPVTSKGIKEAINNATSLSYMQIGAMSGYSDGKPGSAYSYGYWNNGLKPLASSIENCKYVIIRATLDGSSESAFTYIPYPLLELNRQYSGKVGASGNIVFEFTENQVLKIDSRTSGVVITGVWKLI